MAKDLTSKYNTDLGHDETAFRHWMREQSTTSKRNLSHDLYDYDLRGWYQKNGAKAVGAMSDRFKKPNHITFSTASKHHGTDGHRGGKWRQMPSGDWCFTPSATNLSHFSPGDYESYFRDVESGNHVDLHEAAEEKQNDRIIEALKRLEAVMSAPAPPASPAPPAEIDLRPLIEAVVRVEAAVVGLGKLLSAPRRVTKKKVHLRRETNGALTGTTEEIN